MTQHDQHNPMDGATFAEEGERALAEGKPFEALEIATEGVKRWPGDVGLQRIQGRAWSRGGAPEQANRIFTRLYEKGDRHPETLGNLARTHKNFGLAAAEPAERERQLRRAIQYYAMSYEKSGDYWTGINVASLSTLLGENVRAAEVARAVREQCRQLWEGGGGDRY